MSVLALPYCMVACVCTYVCVCAHTCRAWISRVNPHLKERLNHGLSLSLLPPPLTVHGELKSSRDVGSVQALGGLREDWPGFSQFAIRFAAANQPQARGRKLVVKSVRAVMAAMAAYRKGKFCAQHTACCWWGRGWGGSCPISALTILHCEI